jgi:hypothetical protein
MSLFWHCLFTNKLIKKSSNKQLTNSRQICLIHECDGAAGCAEYEEAVPLGQGRHRLFLQPKEAAQLHVLVQLLPHGDPRH